ncbi:MAG TPA: hypothetical protein VNF93_02290 [Buchnera sp. (in: enterobacteria)]|nr:hypothetical protein [Buchnera sp. (in: enterobacteria)]
MTKTYSLAPVPFWYLPDDSGKPLGSGKMYTYSSLNLTEYKPVFQDAGGTLPWTQPVLFDLNGTSGPFYWEFDDSLPEEFYFIQIYDKDDNLVYQINNYPGVTASGGGTVTTNINLKNYIVNGSFLYNQGNGLGLIGPSIPDGTIIAPSSHSQFFTPDITFFNTNMGANDTITFNKFSLGSNPLTGDVAPLYFLNYTSNAFSETRKGIQIPINPDVNTLEDQEMTFSIWARTNGVGANTLQLYIEQYFGTGTGASSTNFFNAGLITLTNNWARYIVNFTIPNVSLFTIGSTGDDGTYIQIRFPTNSNCNIDIAKPSLYIGNNYLISDLESNEQINSLIQTPRTGSTKFVSYLPMMIEPGWIYMNDGTIGNALSNAITRANIDTWFLYNKIWNAIPNTLCPVFTSGGVQTTRLGSAQADWDANKSIRLPISLNRVIGNAFSGGGVVHPIGTFVGADSESLTLDQIPNHLHNGPGNAVDFLTLTGGGGNCLAGAGTAGRSFNTGTISGYTGQQPINIIQSTSYLTFMIKL